MKIPNPDDGFLRIFAYLCGRKSENKHKLVTSQIQKQMNKKFFSLALTLLCSAGFVASCGDDADEVQPKTEQTADNQRTTIYGQYAGWSKATVHGAPIKTAGESLEIKKVDDNTVDIVYTSPTWGTATLEGVTMTKSERGYTFSKAVSVEVNQEQTDWIFGEGVDYITMTQRGPAAGSNPTTKDYPFLLENGFVSSDFQSYEFSFAAYLKLLGAGIYRMTFKSGEVEADTPVV